jgi:hypothetical protein
MQYGLLALHPAHWKLWACSPCLEITKATASGLEMTKATASASAYSLELWAYSPCLKITKATASGLGITKATTSGKLPTVYSANLAHNLLR